MTVSISKYNLMYIIALFAGIFYYAPVGYILLAVTVIIFVSSKQITISADLTDLVVILFLISYLSFGLIFRTITIGQVFKRVILPLICFFVAQGVYKNSLDEARVFIFYYTLGISITNVVSTLSYVRYSLATPVIVPWDLFEIHPTNANACGVISCSLVYYALYKAKGIRNKIAWLIVGIASVYVSIRISKYTTLFVFALIFVVNIILWRGNKRLLTLFLITLSVVLFYFISHGGLSNLDIILRSRSNQSVGESFSFRFTLWKYYLSSVMNNPFSGRLLAGETLSEWAHNIFLDVYIGEGVISMILIIIVYIIHFYHLAKMYHYRVIYELELCFWGSISMSLFACFFIEPAFEATANLVGIAFFIMGLIKGILTDDYLLIKNTISMSIEDI